MPPVSLVTFMSGERQREHRAADGIGLPGPSGMPTGPENRHWLDFRFGALDVWNAAAPLLADLEKQGTKSL
jgi:hypothetical protein